MGDPRRAWSASSVMALVALVATSACSSHADDAHENVATPESEAIVVASNVTRALDYGRSVVGAPYGWWFSGPLPVGAPMWTAGGPPPAPGSVFAGGTNCAGLLNLMLRAVGKPLPHTAAQGTGGTGAYGAYYAHVAKKFDPNAVYPAGTLIGRYYRDTFDQGHVAVVLGNGHVLQSFAWVRGGSPPGVNTDYTLAESNAGGFYEYAVLPEDWLGTAGKSDSECASGDGLYCGGNGVNGDSTTLYRCTGGKTSIANKCASGCVHNPPGTDDACTPAGTCPAGDGFYCGGNGVGGDPLKLYDCTAGELTEMQACALGCARHRWGKPDACKPDDGCPAGPGDYCGGDLVGGDPRTLYHCVNGRLTKLKECAKGCRAMPVGTDDVCE